MEQPETTSFDFLYKNVLSKFFVDGGDDLIAQRKKRIENGFQYVLDKAPNRNLSQHLREVIRTKVTSFEVSFYKKWRKSKYTSKEQFEQKHEKWVHMTLTLPPSIISVDNGQRPNTQQKKSFEVLSERQKNRRAEDFNTCEVDELILASVKAAQKSNETDLAYVLRLLYKDHGKATKLISLLQEEKSLVKPTKMTPLRGLTYLLDNNLSTSQYRNTRVISKENGSSIFPAYNKIAEAKKECRPPVLCHLSDVSATLPLQALLDHTASRLLLLQKEVIERLKIENNNETKLKLQVKWGCDGSADHSKYNQKYVNVESTGQSDANFFATTLVPLRITTSDNSNMVIWSNVTPQSPRWCRPLRLQFAKETEAFTLQEVEFVKKEIAALTPFSATVAGVRIRIEYQLYLTMIDGKTLAAITETKSKQSCSICKATPTQFNNLENVEVRFKPKKQEFLNYGLSVLHLWIRSLEWLLHLSYRKDIKKWQLRGADLKAKANKRKEKVQDRFWKRMKLRVDFPSTKGTGNSNNGNVCRTAFSNPKLLSQILNLNKKLIENVRTILLALSCQFPLNIERFHDFCMKTSYHYVRLYKWFPFPQSIHKALIHSRDIMLANDLAVGVLAEDASESCNKLYRHNRQFHARKNGRQNNLEDVFNRALDSSDPIVANFGLQKRLYSRFRKNLPIEVLDLLEAPHFPPTKEQELEEIEDRDLADTDEMMDGLSREFADNLDDLNLQEDLSYEEYDDEDYMQEDCTDENCTDEDCTDEDCTDEDCTDEDCTDEEYEDI